MDPDLLVLLIVAVAALAAAALTVVPVLPGTLLVPLGGVACALVVGWDELAWWYWAAQVVLVASYLVIDNVAQALGVRRLGGSRQAMLGGAVGVFAGPIVLAFVLGPVALLVGPPVGAIVGTLIGEQRARRRAGSDPATLDEYRRLGIGAFVAYVVSTVTKLGVVAVQVAVLFLAVR